MATLNGFRPIAGQISKCGCFVNGQVLPDQGQNVPFFTAGPPPQNNIPSLVNAVINLQLAINSLASRLQLITLPEGSLPSGSGGFSSSSHRDGKHTRRRERRINGFQEIQRIVKPVTIYNPNDKSQYVKIKQITHLRMRDPVSGNVWTWNLKPAEAPNAPPLSPQQQNQAYK